MGRKGITEAQVWTACDELLLAGQRPTIERVRLRLTTGSPNTIAPHLDSWFSGLAPRLNSAEPGSEGLPQPSASQSADPPAAIAEFWDRAKTLARQEIVDEFVTREQALQASQAAFEELEQRMALEHETAQLRLNERWLAIAKEVALAKASEGAALRRNDELTTSLRMRDEQIEALGVGIETARAETTAMRQKLEERQFGWDQERTVLNERLDATHRRAAQEIDDARQETKRERNEAAEAKAFLDNMINVLRDTISKRSTEVVEAEHRVAELEQTVEGLNGQLQAHFSTIEALRADLASAHEALSTERDAVKGAIEAATQALRADLEDARASLTKLTGSFADLTASIKAGALEKRPPAS
jgi:chromosome segregation ATPase